MFKTNNEPKHLSQQLNQNKYKSNARDLLIKIRLKRSHRVCKNLCMSLTNVSYVNKILELRLCD